MGMYAPRLRRLVFLVCLDQDRRVALVRTDAPSTQRLTLPTTQREQRESYESAAQRLMTGLGHTVALRPGDLVGRMEAEAVPTMPPGTRREARVFLAHIVSDGLDPRPNGEGPIVWYPYVQATKEVRHLAIPELALFLEGYIEGWIPGGWITLIPQR